MIFETKKAAFSRFIAACLPAADSVFVVFISFQYKALWYIYFSMAREERVQRLGIVSIAFYALDKYQIGFDLEMHRRSHQHYLSRPSDPACGQLYPLSRWCLDASF